MVSCVPGSSFSQMKAGLSAFSSTWRSRQYTSNGCDRREASSLILLAYYDQSRLTRYVDDQTPPRNHLNWPLLMSQSMTWSNFLIQRSLLPARSPQNCSGCFRLSSYRDEWLSLTDDSCSTPLAMSRVKVTETELEKGSAPTPCAYVRTRTGTMHHCTAAPPSARLLGCVWPTNPPPPPHLHARPELNIHLFILHSPVIQISLAYYSSDYCPLFK